MTTAVLVVLVVLLLIAVALVALLAYTVRVLNGQLLVARAGWAAAERAVCARASGKCGKPDVAAAPPRIEIAATPMTNALYVSRTWFDDIEAYANRAHMGPVNREEDE